MPPTPVKITELRVAHLPDHPPCDDDHVVTRSGPPGLRLVLMRATKSGRDGVELRSTVSPAEAASLGLPSDRLFREAIDQSLGASDMAVEPMWEDQVKGLWVVAGDSTVTALFYRLKRFPRLLGEHGSFVALADKHTMVFFRIDAAESLDSGPVVAACSALAESEELSTDFPIWWTDGSVYEAIEFIADPDGDGSFMSPGPLFSKVADRLQTR
ncbi:MAG TPA: hypothetical protein VFF65_07055 [Phycisphaerales bacterium]|nr:hypothetical protein [Phycisphaerales bacterium]